MTGKARQKSDVPAEKYRLLLAISWTLLIAFSLAWNIHEAHTNNIEKARVEARTFYDIIFALRRWSASHGGVYVPISDTLQPNPYLNMAERDVITTGGRKLTLVNPAWMTRQVFEMLNKQSRPPTISHLTSLKYLNPVNRPDPWEEEGLRAFEKGAKEVSDITTIDNEPYMRLLKPFVAEQGCLKCHGRQGYKVGDIRGGISIEVPMRPHLEAESKEQKTLVLSHIVLWLIGAGGIVLFSRDLQRRQGRLVESEEKYRILFESNPHPMWVYDLETLAFLTVNDAAVDHYGYTRGEFLSMTIKDIRPPEDVPDLLANVARVTTGLDKAGVWRHRKKDGGIIYVEITSHVVDFEGRRAELVLASDATERLKLEEQFRQAQKMEAVGLLAGGVAHDFNNILTAIMGYGNLLQMKMERTDPLRPYTDQILVAAEQAAQLTQSLLAFSRKQVLNPAPVSLNAIIRKVDKLLRRLIREDIEFRTDLTAEDVTVMADSVQIEQILMNLATNARDAMPNGGVLTAGSARVELDEAFIAAHKYAKPGTYARMSVVDTGVGMDEKTRERIFEPFFTTKEMGKGTGLGLATVYGIIKQHDGYIEVQSEPGRGAAFHMYLPVIREAVPPPAPAEPLELRGGTETILVAEDDEVIRGLTRSVLREFGYAVIEAVDGEDAVRKFRENRDAVQLLLLDVIMPKKSGKDAFDEIRATAPHIKALFISGYSADMISKEGVLEKGVNFIPKPLSPKELLKKVREVLDG